MSLFVSSYSMRSYRVDMSRMLVVCRMSSKLSMHPTPSRMTSPLHILHGRYRRNLCKSLYCAKRSAHNIRAIIEIGGDKQVVDTYVEAGEDTRRTHGIRDRRRLRNRATHEDDHNGRMNQNIMNGRARGNADGTKWMHLA